MEWPCTTYWKEGKNQTCTILIKQGQLFHSRHLMCYKSTIAPHFDDFNDIWSSYTVYEIMNNHVPSYLTNRFSVRDSGYNLRGHKNVLIPKPRTEFKKRLLSYRRCNIHWNALPDLTKQSCNISEFQKRLLNK